MQKTQWRSRPSCWKIWWIDDNRSQSSKRQLRISKQSSICSRGAGSSHSVDPGASVQNQNFARNPENRSKWKLVGRFHGMLHLSAKRHNLFYDGKTLHERRFGQPCKGPIIPFSSLFECHPITAKGQSRIHQFGKKVLPGLFLGYALVRGGNLESVTCWSQTLRNWRRLTHRKSTRKDSRKRWYFPNKEILFSQSQMDESNPLEENTYKFGCQARETHWW